MENRDIITLSGGAHVRKRFSMYLDADPEVALQLAFRELWVNSCDELTFRGRAGTILLTVNSQERTMTVADDGDGIPFDHLKDAYLVVNTGSNFTTQAGSLAGAMGVGLKAVSHTAEMVEITSCNKGQQVDMKIIYGEDQGILSSFSKPRKTNKRGVTTTFKPAHQIYGDSWINEKRLLEELDEAAKFYPSIKFIIKGDFGKKTISYPKGLNLKGTEAYYESKNLIISLSLQPGHLKPFGNRLYLRDGGAFFTHFKTQLTKTINDSIDFKINGHEIQAALSGYVSVYVQNPIFSNQQKSAIGNKEVNAEISNAVKEIVRNLKQSSKWQNFLRTLEMEVKAEAAACRAREKIKQAKEEFTKKKLTSSNKFIDTDSKKRDECELYITEGLSASSTLKKVKPRNAGIMMLRGKVLNVARTDFESVSKNEELTSLAKGLGATMSDNGFLLPIKKCRFGKIIIFADADEDGLAIEALVLTFFYKYFPQLIDAGMIYGMEPKLFGVTWGKPVKHKFFSNESETAKFIKENKITSPKIARYKGLGSYEEDEFPALIDPKERVLRQFKIKNVEKARKAIQLMEPNMDARRALMRGEFDSYDV
jgi:DNA gyrase subunit B